MKRVSANKYLAFVALLSVLLAGVVALQVRRFLLQASGRTVYLVSDAAGRVTAPERHTSTNSRLPLGEHVVIITATQEVESDLPRLDFSMLVSPKDRLSGEVSDVHIALESGRGRSLNYARPTSTTRYKNRTSEFRFVIHPEKGNGLNLLKLNIKLAYYKDGLLITDLHPVFLVRRWVETPFNFV